MASRVAGDNGFMPSSLGGRRKSAGKGGSIGGAGKKNVATGRLTASASFSS
jgi:hypothetical protein